MAALNLAHELLKLRGRGDAVDTDVGQKIRQLRERVESALTEASSSSCDRARDKRGIELFLAAVRCTSDASRRRSRLRYGAACGVRHVSGYLSTLT